MATTAEVNSRRAMLYDQRVVPKWSKHVDSALLEIIQGEDLDAAPTLLVAEVRTGHLVSELIPNLPQKTRYMVVDPSSEMLDLTRKRLQSSGKSIFYSTQSMTKLSYANGVFHAVVCGNGILTRTDIRRAGPELIRVLRPEGVLLLAVPLRSTFTLFPDLLRESLLRLEMHHVKQTLDAYLEVMVPEEEIGPELDRLGLELVEQKLVSFEVEFENAEDFLFSPFMEGFFLPRWLAICSDQKQRETLFQDVARAIDIYYHGLPIHAGAKVACLMARRKG